MFYLGKGLTLVKEKTIVIIEQYTFFVLVDYNKRRIIDVLFNITFYHRVLLVSEVTLT